MQGAQEAATPLPICSVFGLPLALSHLLTAASQTHCKRGRIGWQPNLCAGHLNSGAGFPTDPGAFRVPLPTDSARTQQAASCPQSLGMTCCHGEKSLGGVGHATSETAPGCAVEQEVLLFLFLGQLIKLHVWTEINSRENSQLAPSEAACDVIAAWKHRSRSRHFP